jgi:hypothetical protein
VFSEEFSSDSTSIGATRDRRWTAEDMYYSSDYKVRFQLSLSLLARLLLTTARPNQGVSGLFVR